MQKKLKMHFVRVKVSKKNIPPTLLQKTCRDQPWAGRGGNAPANVKKRVTSELSIFSLAESIARVMISKLNWIVDMLQEVE